MNDTRIAVSRFNNPNGVTSWRLAGERIRRNFKSRDDAIVAKSELESEAAKATAGFRTAATLLSDDQLRAAEAAFQRLAERRRPFSFYIDFALTNDHEGERDMPILEAVATDIREREKDQTRGLLSASMVRQIKWEPDALQRRFPDLTVDPLTPKRLAPYFERAGASLKTNNNRRGLV